MKAATVCYLLIASSALAGCAGAASSSQADLSYPPNYKQTLVAMRGTLFKDPDSVRDVGMSDPKANAFGWKSCLRANAKNGFGGYTGMSAYTIQFYRNGNPPIMQEPTIYDGCGSELYEPFPELEGNYVPPAPAPVEKQKPKAAPKPKT